jgi:hypothetical protein
MTVAMLQKVTKNDGLAPLDQSAAEFENVTLCNIAMDVAGGD